MPKHATDHAISKFTTGKPNIIINTDELEFDDENDFQGVDSVVRNDVHRIKKHIVYYDKEDDERVAMQLEEMGRGSEDDRRIAMQIAGMNSKDDRFIAMQIANRDRMLLNLSRERNEGSGEKPLSGLYIFTSKVYNNLPPELRYMVYKWTLGRVDRWTHKYVLKNTHQILKIANEECDYFDATQAFPPFVFELVRLLYETGMLTFPKNCSVGRYLALELFKGGPLPIECKLRAVKLDRYTVGSFLRFVPKAITAPDLLVYIYGYRHVKTSGMSPEPPDFPDCYTLEDLVRMFPGTENVLEIGKNWRVVVSHDWAWYLP